MVYVCACAYYDVHMEVRSQLCGVCSLFALFVSVRDWCKVGRRSRQVTLPAETSH